MLPKKNKLNFFLSYWPTYEFPVVMDKFLAMFAANNEKSLILMEGSQKRELSSANSA